MARQLSLSILAGDSRDYLAEKYGPVIENIQTTTISGEFKNDELSANPTTGTIEAKRFVNASIDAYGTARAAGAGTSITAAPVTVAIDQHKESIEEVEESDTVLYGVDGLITKRSKNQGQRAKKHLEKAFWAEAENGTEKNYTYVAKKKEALMAAVVEMETLQNNFVDGVDRDLMGLVVTPSLYEAVRDDIDLMPNANVDSSEEFINTFHGVEIKKSNDLGNGVDYVLMVKGSIAQPVRFTIKELEKIQNSKAYTFGLFIDYGTKIVAPDLVFYGTVTEADPS